MSTEPRPLIGTSPASQAVRRSVALVAPTEATVLLLGETGTGKELVARLIHDQSRRRSNPFVAVNCGALAPNLLTSELFGHEAGAFTGAMKRRLGRFEQANHGTLFLDEIGELLPDAQVLLLRTLQERVIERVGSGEAIPIDVRIVAATNLNLAAAKDSGRFREDLFYRLNIFPINLPPLRARSSDIPELVEHFLRVFVERYRRPQFQVAASTMRALIAHNWPGNVRELQNILERAVIMSEGDSLTFDPGWLVGSSVVDTAKSWAAQERQRILDALRAADGRVYGPGGAAQRLGLNPTTLYSKIRKHGIHRNGAEWL